MEHNHQTYWERCLAVIKDNVSETVYEKWFAPIVAIQYHNRILVLQVPSQFYVEILEERYIDLLSKVIYKEIGSDTRLEYRVVIDRHSNTTTTIPGDSRKLPVHGSVLHMDKARLPEIDSQLNSAYGFSTFVEGKSNKLARTAGLSIANAPGRTAFNPLFLYGRSGVGKTHLAHAIGIAAKQQYPSSRVLYVPANTFQIQYTDAVRNNKQNDFLGFYQTIDVLIIDDIQEFAGKPGTQNTFFHIFNHLHQSGKQLVMTSDRAPYELKDMEQRLLSRFKWGLAAEMESPDYQLRKAILQSKIYHNGLDIPEAVVDYIAENVTENVRDLEGVLVSIMAHSTLTDAPVDLDLAHKVMSNIIELAPKTITVEKIREVVCSHFALSTDAIATKSRKRDVVQARQIAMFLAKQLTANSLASIGSIIGQRDHATVLHACNVVSDLMEIDKGFRQTVETIEERIRA